MYGVAGPLKAMLQDVKTKRTALGDTVSANAVDKAVAEIGD
jgi:hypothetical protein